MEFENQTQVQAKFGFGGLAPDVHGAWIVARTTWRIGNGPELSWQEAEPCPIFASPLRTDFGTFPSDDFPIHHGCELVIAGVARPSARTRCHRVEARVGARYSDVLHVFGMRRWERSGRRLSASAPEPFDELPLTWDHAFGGAGHWLNPAGRGHYESESAALDQPLASIEDPNDPVREWSSAPTPVAWAPVANARRWQIERWAADWSARNPARAPSPEALLTLEPALSPVAAPPRRIIAGVRAGELVTISGLGAPIELVVPEVPLVLHATLAGERFARPLELSGLWVFAEAKLVVLTHRTRFRYPLRPREQRTATLTHSM